MKRFCVLLVLGSLSAGAEPLPGAGYPTARKKIVRESVFDQGSPNAPGMRPSAGSRTEVFHSSGARRAQAEPRRARPSRGYRIEKNADGSTLTPTEVVPSTVELRPVEASEIRTTGTSTSKVTTTSVRPTEIRTTGIRASSIRSSKVTPTKITTSRLGQKYPGQD